MLIKTAILIWIFLYFCSLILCLNLDAADIDPGHGNGVKLVLKVKQLRDSDLFHRLRKLNFIQYDKLTPTTYILDYNGSRRHAALRQTISKIKRLYKKEILELEPTREYNDTLKPVAINKVFYKSDLPDLKETNLICDNYYGMGIPEAWSSGYTGRGVTIAITDVGINTGLLDLKQNINKNLSFNFVDNNNNVIPEYFYNIRDRASYFTDHGNKMASVIAATKGNNICSAGIAYNATIVPLKIFKVTKTKSDFLGLHPRHWTSSDIFARALKYNLHTIDIFANAWAPVNLFDKLDIATNEVISYGASNGRHGLGTIHVVPSGPPGSQLSNNIDTITVNGIGRNGTVLAYTYTDASVLTSGLGEGNNLTSPSMVTTTLKNRCVTGFNGVSACTAQISWSPSKHLSLRDVQHLLVHSSDYHQLQERTAFQKNAAGRYYNGVFGFGLLNANRFVENALKHRHVSPVHKETLELYIPRPRKTHTQTFEFCYECKTSDKSKCLTVLEHVVLEIDIKATSRADIKIEIKSPGGTRSVLMDLKPKQIKPISVKKLRLVSVHFWDENAFGKWLLHVKDKHSTGNIQVTGLTLNLYGTASSTTVLRRRYGSDCSSNDKSNTRTTSLKSTTTKSPNSKEVIYKENNSEIDDIIPYLPISIGLFLMIIFVVGAFCNPISDDGKETCCWSYHFEDY